MSTVTKTKRISQKQLQTFIDNVANKVVCKFPSTKGKGFENVEVYVSKVDGSYIDHVEFPEQLKTLLRWGVTEELQSTHKKDAEDTSVQLGYNPTNKKWYGWSHRAAIGIGIGWKVKKGDDLLISKKTPVGFTAKTKDDCKLLATVFAKNVA